jgi:uncharacterized membrane protein (DUF2068 family)
VKKSDGPIIVIGCFKLAKAVLLLAIGLAGLIAGPSDLADVVQRLSEVGAFPGHTLAHVADRLWTINPALARRLATAALCYATVFTIEGVGLLFRKTWAEWLTVAVTASFIPLELYEVFKHFGVLKLLTFLINVAIVIYLVRRRAALKQAQAARAPAPMAHGTPRTEA